MQHKIISQKENKNLEKVVLTNGGSIQVIGRGLRLMWREPEFAEMKDESREKLLVKKQEPSNYLDILSIVEHPAFIQFYDRYLQNSYGETKEVPTAKGTIGDFISIPLKKDYKDYDLFWPVILYDKKEFIQSGEFPISGLKPFPITPDKLKKMLPNKEGDIFLRRGGNG